MGGIAAEYVAEKYSVSKKLQDEYALLSYNRSWEAFEQGYLKDELLPIEGKSQDEELLKKRKMKVLLQRAQPIFKKNGTVTVANSCGIHDGASAVLVMEETMALNHGFQPIFRFVDSEVTSIDPHYPGAAPIPAIQTLLARNGLTIAEIDLIEINEAFSSKIVACAKELSIPYEKLNVLGGALTLGHPYGASGSMMITRLFYEVQRRADIQYVLAAMGSGGGIGSAILFKVVA